MKAFDYHVATSPADAVATLSGRPGAAFLAGGTNLIDHMKLGVAAPDLLVDVGRLDLTEVEATDGGGVRIGTNVRNSDLAAHPLIRSRYPMLARALYFTSEIGGEITEGLYNAVAVILAYVFRIDSGETMDMPELTLPPELRFDEHGNLENGGA